MRSPGEGVESATTQVKALSPEIILVALGQGFHPLEASPIFSGIHPAHDSGACSDHLGGP